MVDEEKKLLMKIFESAQNIPLPTVNLDVAGNLLMSFAVVDQSGCNIP